ncbi:UNVERIFIED_ORG: EAL domain-containing protein (putative c-di-GMP-specific phosphodiesterase class I) [Comamonas terrigena]
MSQAENTLLILDDDAAVAQTIGFIAQGLGFSVHHFEDPEPFFEALSILRPSHVALNLIMPRMDGIEVLRRLAQTGCGAALILTSGMGQKVLEAAQATAFERGLNIVGVLPKPFRPQALRQLLTQHQSSQLPRTALATAPTPALLAAAIEQHRLSIVLQPKMDIHSQRIVCAEVLSRWNDPELGSIPPDVFIPLAESHGLMQALTAVVLEQALHWFVASPLFAYGSFAINLSTSCLVDVHLADRIEAACLHLGVAPQKLILEVTESTAMDRTADCFDTLTRLRLKGFRLSIDDFGTGYSSLAQLARMPLSEIKIDKSFVMKLQSSADALKIVDATIRMAKGMGLTSVAEGVENAEVLHTLKSLGCSLAQGYFITRPLPALQFDAWLKEYRAGFKISSESG